MSYILSDYNCISFKKDKDIQNNHGLKRKYIQLSFNSFVVHVVTNVIYI